MDFFYVFNCDIVVRLYINIQYSHCKVFCFKLSHSHMSLTSFGCLIVVL